MASKLPQPAQEVAVTGGLVLGLLDLGVKEIDRDKLRFEFAFRHAWRRFPASSTFPRIARETGAAPYFQIVDDGSSRRGHIPVAIFIEGSQGWTLSVRRPEWFTFEEARDRLEQDSGVPWEQWQQLAKDFAENYFEEDGLQSSASPQQQ